MPELAKNSLIFALLYFSEGLEVSLTSVILPVFLIEKGIEKTAVGIIVALTALPWSIKILWGFIVDKFAFFGRKKFILAGGILASLMSFLLYFINPSFYLLIFCIVMFLTRVGVAFLDVSSDSLSISITKENERGRVNSAMFVGQFAGIAVGSSILPFIADKFSYPHSFLTVGFLILSIMPVIFLIKEKKLLSKEHLIKKLKQSFSKKTSLLVLFLAPLASIPSGMLELLVPIFAKEKLELDIIRIGYINIVYSILMVIGSFSGGAVSDRIGRKKAYFIFIILSGISFSMLYFSNNYTLLTILWAVSGFFIGAKTSISCAMFMDFTEKRVGATQFAVYTSASNFGSSIGSAVSGIISNSIGFMSTFFISGIMLIPSLIILSKVNSN